MLIDGSMYETTIGIDCFLPRFNQVANRDIQIPELQMRESDIRWSGNLMFRQGQQDHDHVSHFGLKIEEHRKLVRY